MRTNSLLRLAALLLVFGLGCMSCTNEDDPAPFKKGEAAFTFTIEGLASTRAGTEPALEQEKTISNVFVGFYDTSGGNKITGGYYSGAALTAVSNGVYTVQNVVIPQGREMDIYMVANPKEEDLGEVASLSELKRKVTAYTAATGFTPETLVKVGERSSYTFSAGTSVNVELKQLAAKVHVKLTLEENTDAVNTTARNWAFGDNLKMSVGNVALQSMLSPDGVITQPTVGSYVVPDTEAKVLNFTFYTYKKQKDTDPLALSIEGDLTSSGQTLKDMKYRTSINPEGGLLPGTLYGVTGTLKVDPKVTGKVQWVVVDITQIGVEVPPFK